MLKKMVVAAALSAVFSGLISGVIVPSVKGAAQPLTDETGSVAESSEPETVPLYVVSEYDGKVAVFRPGNLVPEQLLETPVAALPESDRTLLRIGIRIWDEATLQTVLEDYS